MSSTHVPGTFSLHLRETFLFETLSPAFKACSSHMDQFKKYLQHRGTTCHHSVPHKAESNGTLVTVLCNLCAKNPIKWKQKLHKADFAINTSLNASSGFFPYELLHGCTTKHPVQRTRCMDTTPLQERHAHLCAIHFESASNSE